MLDSFFRVLAVINIIITLYIGYKVYRLHVRDSKLKEHQSKSYFVVTPSGNYYEAIINQFNLKNRGPGNAHEIKGIARYSPGNIEKRFSKNLMKSGEKLLINFLSENDDLKNMENASNVNLEFSYKDDFGDTKKINKDLHIISFIEGLEQELY